MWIRWLCIYAYGFKKDEKRADTRKEMIEMPCCLACFLFRISSSFQSLSLESPSCINLAVGISGSVWVAENLYG